MKCPEKSSIGLGLVSIARHPAFRGLPAILELGADAARRGGLAYLAREGALGGAPDRNLLEPGGLPWK